MRLIGLDPGLRITGWGIVEAEGNRLSYVACGVVRSQDDLSLAERLTMLHVGILEVLKQYAPDEAAVEETFVNRNPTSTLKLGQARGVVMLAPALLGLSVAEYTPNLIKKNVVGTGHAAKDQVGLMVRTLLPGAAPEFADAADALAVAICHARYRASGQSLEQAIRRAEEKARR
ncbi:MAG: crossover junction endodeoxyribonuclease RuvC [Rhodospirillaceae bacterium]|nr:crossover junction endodeoxyribonuclease RuvC [Rhodospirillaceae bacterium]